MRKHLWSAIFTIFALILVFSVIPESASAVQYPVGNLDVKVKAQIGDFYLNLSGYIAPNASVTLIANDTVITSTTADSKGYFSIPQVLVKQGFSSFCLDAIDFKRLGESEACFTIPPMQASVTISNIFLPPTLGLFHTTINAGEQATAFGYSMPGAQVTVYFPDGTLHTATADSTGYYEFKLTIDKAGKYELFADATYNGKKSEKPVKSVLLTALGLPGQVGVTVSNFWQNLLKLLSKIPLGPLWLVLPIIILILILLRKLKPGVFSWVPSLLPAFDFLKKGRKLHHAWFVGY